MSYERLAYADHDTADRMHLDCSACAREMSLPGQRLSPEAVRTPAPSLAFTETETPKPEIEVTDAAAHLAARLHLHLD